MSPADPSVEEVALQVLLASFEGPSVPADWRDLLAEGLGGICLFGSNLTGSREETRALVTAIRDLRPAAIVATDEEGGDVTRLHVVDASPVPGAAVLGAVDDLALTRVVGAAVGDDLAEVGIDLTLGPVADVNSQADNPVIGTRSFGADATLVGRHVAAWVEGVQDRGVAACVKHFPGHGDTAQDSHLALPVVDVDLPLLRSRELVPFAAAVAAGARSIMTSHIVVPALDEEWPATLSPTVLTVLRDELGFEGAIVSDALDMAGASAERGIPEAAVLALAAGCDLLCIGPDKDAALIREVQAAIVAAVATGRLPLERLTDAAYRAADLAAAGAGDRAEKVAAADVGDDALVTAARRALIVEGRLPNLTHATVVSIETTANIAVGAGRWGVDADLVLDPGTPLPHGTLVVQVRDAHRRPEVAATLAAASGPLVVVEWGWPGPRSGWDDASHARLCARGNSRPSIQAVEAILREAGWPR